MNTLYFGDNLEILRDKIPENVVDLIYLDPPFQSGKNYNIIFQPKAGKIKGATAQIKTFEDTWKWGEEVETEYTELIKGTLTKEPPNQKLIELMKAMRGYLGECSMMAYLSMMAPRLLEMRRVLKNTGSIYLHCDPTASHYLKLLMDGVFGANNYRNEVVWHYRRWTAEAKRFQRMHDIIFWYSKSDKYIFTKPLQPYSKPEWIETTVRGIINGKLVRLKDEKGHYITRQKENLGVLMHDVWEDINFIPPTSKERIGYPTQKPEKLLERIIKASSNKGDLVLDPFCGCGTATAVAEKLNRKWVGIDITYLAIDVIKKRLEKNNIKEGKDFKIDGEPSDYQSAQKLAEIDPFQFQIWCVSKINAVPSTTKTGDKGVDGIINFVDKTKKEQFGKGVIQVKGTKGVNPAMVRELKGTIQSQNADFGILITLQPPTQNMKVEAVKEGKIEISGKEVPKIQLLTVEDLLKSPIPIILPPLILPSFEKPDIKKEQKLPDLPF